MLEIRHLRTLRALRAAGSLVRAADMLHLTQSALSHQVKLLEDRYGSPLFERKSMPVVFTAAGSRLLALADQVLPSVEQAERDVARMLEAEPGRLRLGLDCPACESWLLPVLASFRQRWPDIDLDLAEDGETELVLGSDPSLSLLRQEIVVLVAARHPLAARRRIGVAELQGEHLVQLRRQHSANPLAPLDLPLRYADSVPALVHAVAARRGVAALPLWAVQSYLNPELVQALSLGETGFWQDFGLRASPEVLGWPCVADLAGLIRAHAAQHLAGVRLSANNF